MRETEPSPEFATQTAPAPTAIAAGSLPVWMSRWNAKVTGSARHRKSRRVSRTHSEPKPTAIAVVMNRRGRTRVTSATGEPGGVTSRRAMPGGT